MSFLNTEISVTYSGIGRSFIDFYADQKGIALAQSGAQTIASGAGVLFGVIGLAGLLSGGMGTPTSQSGCIIAVCDAASGIAPVATSGANTYGSNTAGILYQYNFGASSGAILAGALTPLAPPDLVGINTVFRSGLVATISGGVVGSLGISLLFGKGM